jgi:hypothetical protein
MTTSTRKRAIPRQRQPELERDFARSPSLGYEAPEETGLVRCLAHGFPSPLVRWHFHEDYELHLITETSGKAFIGDWIGPFQPGTWCCAGRGCRTTGSRSTCPKAVPPGATG